MLRGAFEALERIGSTGSTLSKAEILRQNKDDAHLRILLKACYNPFTVYHVKKLPDIKPTGDTISEERFSSFLLILEALTKRQVTGNAAIESITFFLKLCSPVEYKWYRLVVLKDLNIGIQAKSINSVMGPLVPQFNCMLADKFKAFPDLFVLQAKLDGKRALINTTTGDIFSRKGHLITNFPHISQAAKMMEPGNIIDGEIFEGDWNKTMQKEHRKEMKLNAFDIIPESEFGIQDGAENLDRILTLSKVLSGAPENFPIVEVGTSEVLTAKQSALAMSFYAKCLELGYEGSIVKDAQATYQYKRSTAWQKLKVEKSADLRVVDIQEGKPGTKYVGMVGALIVDYKGLQVGVGSGLTDDQRDFWYRNPEEIVGKIIEVKYQEETKNEAGTESLRFPVFKRVRDDK